MFLLLSCGGKVAGKYCAPHISPYPLRHASVAMMVSGSGDFVSHSMDMLLYCSRNAPHQFMSCLASLWMWYFVVLSIVLSQLSSLAMKVLPGLMHLLANCSFPIRLSSSFLLTYSLVPTFCQHVFYPVLCDFHCHCFCIKGYP